MIKVIAKYTALLIIFVVLKNKKAIPLFKEMAF
jgi:hypothetical protein